MCLAAAVAANCFDVLIDYAVLGDCISILDVFKFNLAEAVLRLVCNCCGGMTRLLRAAAVAEITVDYITRA